MLGCSPRSWMLEMGSHSAEWTPREHVRHAVVVQELEHLATNLEGCTGGVAGQMKEWATCQPIDGVPVQPERQALRAITADILQLLCELAGVGWSVDVRLRHASAWEANLAPLSACGEAGTDRK